MRICCLQEVYFEPKMFETIGFHHQGSYKICVKAYSYNTLTNKKEYGFPILNRKIKYQQQQNQNELDRIQIKQLSYSTKIFDVSFNEQEFTFYGGGCRFKIQTELSPNAETPVYLQVLLKKCNGASNQGISEENRVMSSAEDIIKLSIYDQKDFSNQKIGNGGVSETSSKIKKMFKKGKNNIEQIVCKFQIQISNQPDCFSKPHSIYQMSIFPVQQYFGKIYYLLSHVKIGFKTRASQIRFSQFASGDYKQKSLRKSIKKYQQRSLPQSSQTSRNSVNTLILSAISNPKILFDRFIKQQIIELAKLNKIEEQLIESSKANLTRQKRKRSQNVSIENSSFSNINSNYRNWKNRQNVNLEICVPSEQISQTTQSLFQYFQCESQETLAQKIYEEQCCLAELICSKWHYLIRLFYYQRWNSSYYQKTINNFKDQLEYIEKNKVASVLQSDGQYIEWKPKFKYKSYIHENFPNMYVKITKTKQLKPHKNVSNQHILFILVHGFNGNEFDMSRIKSFISYFCTPHFLVLKNISTKIFEDLNTIGKAAAEEISEFLKLRPFIKKINFIGFSLGGIIVRSSLKYLKKYEELFNLFITLSSPHLGVNEINSCIVKTGLKVIEKVRGAKNIKQLLLNSQNVRRSDIIKEEQLQQTQMSYLQALSRDQSISSFSLILAIGSQDDKYVPGYSATLDYKGDDERIIRMQTNLKKNIRNLHQIYVKFSNKKQGSVWERITGRRIHINFLDDDSFLYLILAQYFYFF